MLFQRILQNVIHVYRRQKVHAWDHTAVRFPGPDGRQEHDPLGNHQNPPTASTKPESPQAQLDNAKRSSAIERSQKSPRQRSLPLRYWEEMDIAETAANGMLSRAALKPTARGRHALAAALAADHVAESTTFGSGSGGS